ncbi:MAG: Asp23/Gls24 family envelope stress response protein [Clostridia bacterium]|nr:Asp23/Gls24 family envelope stress response protein [Clostridia bacterium]
MARIKKVTRNKHEGKIIYGDGIVDGIVYLAVAEIPYAELYTLKQRAKNRSKAIKVTFAKDGVHVEVVVKVHYSQAVSDMAFKIQEVIRHNVEAMTDYHIANVNVVVRGVLFDEKVALDVSAKNEPETEKSEEVKPETQDK